MRRRAIVPGFHSKWLNRMVRLFSECAQVLVDKLDEEEQKKTVIDMGMFPPPSPPPSLPPSSHSI